jgi:septum formation protein
VTRLVLASGSPRRLSLLQAAGCEVVDVRPPDVDEKPHPQEAAGALVRRLARDKALAIAPRAASDEVVLSADTVVALAGTVLGKPDSDPDAAAMLTALSGQLVTVWSGVAVMGPAMSVPSTVVVATFLRMHLLSPAAIAAYVATGEPHGAAGSFKLQGAGARLIADRAGCWTNVVGLPICEVARLLTASKGTITQDGCAPGVTPAPMSRWA